MSNKDADIINQWEETINSVQREDHPISEKRKALTELKNNLKEVKSKLSKSTYKTLCRLVIEAQLKLKKKEKKNILKNFKMDVKDEKPFVWRLSTEVPLLLPDGTIKQDGKTGEKPFALSLEQQKILKEIEGAPPGFELVKPKPRGKKGGKTKRRRRKKSTKRKSKSRRRMRRKRKGGHAGNTIAMPPQPNYTQLAAMREANPQRVYYLYAMNPTFDPPLVAPVGNGFTHEFEYDNEENKIAITGHPLNNPNSTAYHIPNPIYHTMSNPSAADIADYFYNPSPSLRREFRDDNLTDMMGNLQMGGSGIKSTIEGNGCDFLPHHKLCKGDGRKKRRKMRGGEEYTLHTLYDFLSENSEEIHKLSIDVGPILSILKGFKETSEKTYMNGSYYIMNIKRNKADVINAEVVTEALQKGFNGSATNSFEYMSMMRTLEETTLLKTFFTKDLPIIKAHFEFKPGAPGAVEAKVSFNTAKDQQSGGRKKRTRKRRKSRGKSRRRMRGKRKGKSRRKRRR